MGVHAEDFLSAPSLANSGLHKEDANSTVLGQAYYLAYVSRAALCLADSARCWLSECRPPCLANCVDRGSCGLKRRMDSEKGH